VDLEISDPDMKVACFGRKPLPGGTLVSNGDKMACVVDKVNQFAAEPEASGTDAEERLVALKFLLRNVTPGFLLMEVKRQGLKGQAS
jgi:hypothetical protein